MPPLPKRVLLNGLFLDYPYSGTWTYTRNICRELARLAPNVDFSLAVRRGWRGSLPHGVKPVRPRWPFSPSGHSSKVVERIDKLAWEQLAFPLAGRGTDLLHSLYFAAPAIPLRPLVVTVHDIISLSAENSHGASASVYGRLMRETVRRASALITVSQHARREIASALDFPFERIHVTYEAPDPSLSRVTDATLLAQAAERYRLPARYILYLGGTQRRKNIETLVRAWALASPPDTKLVIVGSFPHSDPLVPNIPELVRGLGLGDSVRMVSAVAPQDLSAIFSAALAFCYPSRYEGFGLPPLEAMACGTPVLCSRATSLAEIVAGGGHLIPPDDLEVWRQALTRISTDENWRDELSQRGTAHLARFSWTDTARKTLDVYRRVLED